MAESTALISKVFSGALSDYLGKRKGLAPLGRAMGALTKPVFALANGVGAVVAARFIDRVGKGTFEQPSAYDGCTLKPVIGVATSRPIV